MVKEEEEEEGHRLLFQDYEDILSNINMITTNLLTR